MIENIVTALGYSECAEVALLLFIAAFGLAVYGTLSLREESTERFASIPLSDEVKDPFDGK